jgi:hypothetical protein
MDRDRFAGQQRFVDHELAGGQQHGVGRHAVTFEDDDGVAAHHLAAGDAPLLAVAHDQGARACNLAQGVEDALAAGLLDNGDEDRKRCEGQQHEGFAEVAQHKIDRAGAQQQRKHGFAQHAAHDVQQGPALGRGQVVVALGPQPGDGLLFGEAGIVGHGVSSIMACRPDRSHDQLSPGRHDASARAEAGVSRSRPNSRMATRLAEDAHSARRG